MKKILIAIIVILGLYLSTAGIMAQPTVDITFEPEEPAPESTTTFTATVSGDNISEVYISVSECKAGLCFADSFNESMDEISAGVYQKEITLIHSDATYIEYWAVINDNGTWYDFKLDFETANLKISSNGNGGTTTNGDGTDDTPGFELILILLSFVILIFLFKRKRE